MAGNNPSIVNTDLGNNYNISDQGGLLPNQVSAVNDLFSRLDKPTTGALPNDTYYPGMDRGTVVGQINNKTLGSIPLFASGSSGLIPWGVYDQYQAEKAKNAQYKYMLMQSDEQFANQYFELSNPFATDNFNATIMENTDKRLRELSASFGGDMAKARAALKHDPKFRMDLIKYNSFARGYNQIFGDAMGVVKSANDPNTWVPPELYSDALNIFEDTDKISGKPIDELLSTVDKFKTNYNVNYFAQAEMAAMPAHVQENLFKSTDLSNADNDVLTEISTKYKYGNSEAAHQREVKEYAEMVWKDKYAKIFGNDENQKQNFISNLTKRIEMTRESKTSTVRVPNDKSRAKFRYGITQDPNTKQWQGSNTIYTSPDGRYSYNVQYASLRSKSGGIVRADIPAGTPIIITNSDGKKYHGTASGAISTVALAMHPDQNKNVKVQCSLDDRMYAISTDQVTGKSTTRAAGITFSVYDANGRGAPAQSLTTLLGSNAQNVSIEVDETNLHGTLAAATEEPEYYNEMVDIVKNLPITNAKVNDASVRGVTIGQLANMWGEDAGKLRKDYEEAPEEFMKRMPAYMANYQIVGEGQQNSVSDYQYGNLVLSTPNKEYYNVPLGQPMPLMTEYENMDKDNPYAGRFLPILPPAGKSGIQYIRTFDAGSNLGYVTPDLIEDGMYVNTPQNYSQFWREQNKPDMELRWQYEPMDAYVSRMKINNPGWTLNLDLLKSFDKNGFVSSK